MSFCSRTSGISPYGKPFYAITGPEVWKVAFPCVQCTVCKNAVEKCDSGRPQDHFFLHSRSPGAEMPIESPCIMHLMHHAWIVESMQSFNPASHELRISSTGLWVTMKRRRTLLQDLHACARCVDCKLDCHGDSTVCQAAYHEALKLATQLSDGVDLQVWWISHVQICIHARLRFCRLVMPYWSTIPAATMDELPSTLSWTAAMFWSETSPWQHNMAAQGKNGKDNIFVLQFKLGAVKLVPENEVILIRLQYQSIILSD